MQKLISLKHGVRGQIKRLKLQKKTVFGFSNLASNTDALKCIPQFLTIQLYKIWFWLCLHLQKLYDTFFVNQQYQMYPK